MRDSAMEDRIVRKLSETPAFADACGRLQALTGVEDFAAANVAVSTMINPSVPHYHEKSTEFYFVLEGSGRLIVGCELIRLDPGTLVVIPPRQAHYTIPRTTLKIFVVSSPAWIPEDQIFLPRDRDEVLYYQESEKNVLITEVLARFDGLEYEEGPLPHPAAVLAKDRLMTQKTEERGLKSKTIAELRAMLHRDVSET